MTRAHRAVLIVSVLLLAILGAAIGVASALPPPTPMFLSASFQESLPSGPGTPPAVFSVSAPANSLVLISASTPSPTGSGSWTVTDSNSDSFTGPFSCLDGNAIGVATSVFFTHPASVLATVQVQFSTASPIWVTAFVYTGLDYQTFSECTNNGTATSITGEVKMASAGTNAIYLFDMEGTISNFTVDAGQVRSTGVATGTFAGWTFIAVDRQTSAMLTHLESTGTWTTARWVGLVVITFVPYRALAILGGLSKSSTSSSTIFQSMTSLYLQSGTLPAMGDALAIFITITPSSSISIVTNGYAAFSLIGSASPLLSDYVYGSTVNATGGSHDVTITFGGSVAYMVSFEIFRGNSVAPFSSTVFNGSLGNPFNISFPSVTGGDIFAAAIGYQAIESVTPVFGQTVYSSGSPYASAVGGMQDTTSHGLNWSVNLGSFGPNGAMADMLAVIVGSANPYVTPPTVQTDPATNLASRMARLNGEIKSLGTSPSVTCGFLYSTDPGLSPNTNVTVGTYSSLVSYIFIAYNLNSSTQYYFAAWCNGTGMFVVGATLSFFTPGGGSADLGPFDIVSLAFFAFFLFILILIVIGAWRLRKYMDRGRGDR